MNWVENLKYYSGADKIRRAVQANKRWLRSLRRLRLLESRRKNGMHSSEHRNYDIVAPEIFSLSKNYNATLECLRGLKNLIKQFDKKPLPRILFDLTPIQDLQPAAALVLAAELDRWRLYRGIRLVPQKVKDWNPIVYNFLHELGLFDLLEVDRRHLGKLDGKGDQVEAKVALRFVTGCRADKESTDKLADELAQEVPEFRNILSDREDMALSTALAEASLNSVQHAYEYFEGEFPSKDKRWWASACYLEGGRVVKFFVYDQGAGIAKTLPKTNFGKGLLSWLKGKGGDISAFGSDGDMIKYVIDNNFSSTQEQHRGKGFSQIIEAVTARGGTLRVLSGKGMVIYSKANGICVEPDASYHLGGTLLEWSFRLDQM